MVRALLNAEGYGRAAFRPECGQTEAPVTSQWCLSQGCVAIAARRDRVALEK
jgi:hypothetical protein